MHTVHKEKEAAVLARLAAMNVGNEEPASPVAPKKEDNDSDMDVTADDDNNDDDVLHA